MNYCQVPTGRSSDPRTTRHRQPACKSHAVTELQAGGASSRTLEARAGAGDSNLPRQSPSISDKHGGSTANGFLFGLGLQRAQQTGCAALFTSFNNLPGRRLPGVGRSTTPISPSLSLLGPADVSSTYTDVATNATDLEVAFAKMIRLEEPVE